MKLFKSTDPNIFHYITAVTFNRLPIFRTDPLCQIFINNLIELKQIHPFKLVAYVIMPDHVHFILNPVERDISVVLRKLKGKTARQIIDWLIENNHSTSLAKLKIGVKDREYAVWQKDSSAIDLFSHKFLQQKLKYIHMNPVRASLCKNPEDWRWSSYRAYFPHDSGSVPIEIDINPYWNDTSNTEITT